MIMFRSVFRRYRPAITLSYPLLLYGGGPTGIKYSYAIID